MDKIRLEDKAHANGRFLLAGSANIMALPKLSDPLVGRMSVKTLYCFATCWIKAWKISVEKGRSFMVMSSKTTLLRNWQRP